MKFPMKSLGLAYAIAVAAIISISVTASAQKARITMKQARAAAQQAVPNGTIKSAELEDEDGQLVYSFDIKEGADIKEVWVDATTGQVVKTENETQDDEKNEAQDDEKNEVHDEEREQ